MFFGVILYDGYYRVFRSNTGFFGVPNGPIELDSTFWSDLESAQEWADYLQLAFDTDYPEVMAIDTGFYPYH
jgi:hypothetical protein